MVYIIPKLHENSIKNTKVTDAWKIAKKCDWKHVFIHIFMQIFMSFKVGNQSSFSLVISYTFLIRFKMALD